MNIISVKNLTKKYKSFKAVDNISFNVKKGEIFAFLGPNGAGKTTTIKVLTTVLRPTKGKVLVNGFDVEKQQDKVRQSFGIVFQDPSVDDELTAYENMYFHAVLYKVDRDQIKKRIKDLLQVVELWNRKDELVKNFSGGMKRRLEIARGLLHHPEIFYLDEPTIGLDVQTRRKLWKYIKRLNKEKKVTVFFTTHYMEEAAKMADYIYIIDHGKIIADGTNQELQKQTKTDSLENAFVKLTGKTIREEEATKFGKMRKFRKMRSRRKS